MLYLMMNCNVNVSCCATKLVANLGKGLTWFNMSHHRASKTAQWSHSVSSNISVRNSLFHRQTEWVAIRVEYGMRRRFVSTSEKWYNLLWLDSTAMRTISLTGGTHFSHSYILMKLQVLWFSLCTGCPRKSGYERMCPYETYFICVLVTTSFSK